MVSLPYWLAFCLYDGFRKRSKAWRAERLRNLALPSGTPNLRSQKGQAGIRRLLHLSHGSLG